MTVKEMSTASIEHPGLSSLQEASTTTAHFTGTGILCHTDKDVLSFQQDIPERYKFEIGRNVYQRLFLLVFFKLWEDVADKVLEPVRTLCRKGVAGNSLKDLPSRQEDSRDTGFIGWNKMAHTNLSIPALSVTFESREQQRV
jgi:hypothetical protein